MSKTFSYFAYGSNLFMQRIHLNNPSAKRCGIGKLENFRLDFAGYSNSWRGASATVAPKQGSHVWGAIWNIGSEHMDSLDKQEGVLDNIYVPLYMDIVLPDGTLKNCKLYQHTEVPKDYGDIKNLPEERRPSKVYLNTILAGARESELPDGYQKFLQQIPHNGYEGKVDIAVKLE